MWRKIRKGFNKLMSCLKLLLSWVLLHTVFRSLLNEDIWIVSEKAGEARDNGYHFYKYIRTNHPMLNANYMISNSAPDKKKVEPFGNIIEADSIKHCLYYLAARVSISSQAYGAFPFSFNLRELNAINKKLCRKDQITVFLQHGIIKDELSHDAFDYEKNNIDFFVCSAEREYEFVKSLYGYPDSNIGCVGLARYDYLLTPHEEDKIVLIMPTWRMWLNRTSKGKLTPEEINRFLGSDYYFNYRNLMTDKAVLEALKNHGYKIIYYMHYQLQDYTHLFTDIASDNVVIANRMDYDVQDLLMRSKILITDYSSVYFDFAMMDKPLIYFQFDRDRFIENHYKKGYFDYEKDGFGPVFDKLSDVASKLINLIQADGKQEPMYHKRSTLFFCYRDGKNCERTYESIERLLEQK